MGYNKWKCTFLGYQIFYKNERTWVQMRLIFTIPTSFVPMFSHFCKNFGIPNMCTFTCCTSNMVQKLAWWWILESKRVATLIDNKLVVFWLNLLLEYLVKTHLDGTNKKKKRQLNLIILNTQGVLQLRGKSERSLIGTDCFVSQYCIF